MRNRNTMRPQKYITDHLFWLITAMIWYRSVLFTAVPGMTVKQSKIILWIVAFVLVAFGYIITMKKRRNDLSLFTNVIFPYELYAVVTYRTYLPRLVWCSVLLASILSFAFIILGMLPTAHNEHPSAEGRKRQAVHSLLGARTITAVCILVLIVPIVSARYSDWD